MDVLETDRGDVRASLLDAANPSALLWSPDLGLTGAERKADVDASEALLRTLGQARCHVSELRGIAPDRNVAAQCSRAIPKLVWLGPAREQRTATGKRLIVDDRDCSVRMLSMGRTHPALAITTSVVAVAGTTAGTVCAESCADPRRLRLATPSGFLPLHLEHDDVGEVETVFVRRNARRPARARLELSLPQEESRTIA